MKKASLAGLLCLGLIASPVIASAAAFDRDVENKLPSSGLDAAGLPIGYYITGVYTIPPNAQGIKSENDGGNAEDIAQILNLKNSYIFFHDSTNNGYNVASLFVEGGIFEDPYQDGQGHICGPNRVAVGKNAIAAYFGNTGVPVPMTKHSHHVYTAPIVKISPDGHFATLFANYQDDQASETGTTWGHVGVYVDDFVKLGGRWYFVHLRPLYDQFPTAGVDPCNPK
jgi:hypothetical protein